MIEIETPLIDITVPGRTPRQCKGEQLHSRDDQRLFLLWSPYDWETEHARLALVDQNNVAYRIISFHQAPKWAKTIFFAKYSISKTYLPMRQ